MRRGNATPCSRSCPGRHDGYLCPTIGGSGRPTLVYDADEVCGICSAKHPGGPLTVERLMRHLGLRGVMRGKVVRTTFGDNVGVVSAGPGQSAVQGRSPKPVVGFRFHLRLDLARVRLCRLRHRCLCEPHRWLTCQPLLRTDFVLDALDERSIARHARAGCNPDPSFGSGSQYVSIRYTGAIWPDLGFEPSVGSKGDCYDNALAETINGL